MTDREVKIHVEDSDLRNGDQAAGVSPPLRLARIRARKAVRELVEREPRFDLDDLRDVLPLAERVLRGTQAGAVTRLVRLLLDEVDAP